jgi:hypothetical protein
MPAAIGKGKTADVPHMLIFNGIYIPIIPFYRIMLNGV